MATGRRLEPPPSTVKLVANSYDGDKEIDNSRADAIWKKWLSNTADLLNFLRGARVTEISIPLSAAKAGGTNDPTWTKLTDDGAGSTGVYAWAFPANNERELFFTIHFGHHYTEDTDVNIHLHWGASDLLAGNVVWGIEYAWVNVGDAAGNSTIITMTAAAGVAGHQENEFPVISGVGKTRQAVLVGRLFRKAVDAADTYPSPAYASILDIHASITIDNED